MMAHRGLPVLLALAAAIAAHGCAPKMVRTVHFGDPQASRRVLIATEQSEFKQAVVAKVIRSFADEPLYFKITDLQNLEFESAEAFLAVVALNSCFAWKIDTRVQAFLESAAGETEIIVLTTAGDPDWRTSVTGVDAITSASTPAGIDRTADVIRTRIQAIIDAATG